MTKTRKSLKPEKKLLYLDMKQYFSATTRPVLPPPLASTPAQNSKAVTSSARLLHPLPGKDLHQDRGDEDDRGVSSHHHNGLQ